MDNGGIMIRSLEEIEDEFASMGATRIMLLNSMSCLRDAEKSLPASASSDIMDGFQICMDALTREIRELNQARDNLQVVYRRMKKEG